MGVTPKRRTLITRNFANDKKASVSKFPRSGFNLSYQSKDTGTVGYVQVQGYQHTQPNDSFSGAINGKIQFDKLLTPLGPELNMHSYTFQCQHRSVDCDWDERMNPNELNSYSAGLQCPMFSVPLLIKKLFDAWFPKLASGATDKTLLAKLMLDAINPGAGESALASWKTLHAVTTQASWENVRVQMINYTFTNTAFSMNTNLKAAIAAAYREDVLSAFAQWNYACLPTDLNALTEYDLVRYYLQPIIWCMGQGSNFERFGYPCPTLYRFHYAIAGDTSQARGARAGELANNQTIAQVAELLCYDMALFRNPAGSYASGGLMVNEYPLRHMATLWIEYLREVHLERRTSWMLYRKWDSTSFLSDCDFTSSAKANSNAVAVCMLFPLPAYFAEDVVTTALTDAPYKHFYAPVLEAQNHGMKVTASSLISPASATQGAADLAHSGIVNAQVHYNKDGVNTTITCPIASDVDKFLTDAYSASSDLGHSLILDFGVMRTMHNAEDYLKRKYYFGDEYQDEMSAQHDVQLSEAELLKPKLIAGKVGLIQSHQMMNTNGDIPSAGDDASGATASMGQRMASMEGDFPSYSYSGYAPNYGMIITLCWVLPTAHYNPACHQNYYRSYIDWPLPVMAKSTEAIIYAHDFSRTQERVRPYGHGPSWVEYRQRLNEVHGDFLDDKADWYCTRWYANGAGAPKLNYLNLKASNVPLNMFVNNVQLDSHFWMLCTNTFNVMRQLPAAVEYM